MLFRSTNGRAGGCSKIQYICLKFNMYTYIYIYIDLTYIYIVSYSSRARSSPDKHRDYVTHAVKRLTTKVIDILSFDARAFRQNLVCLTTSLANAIVTSSGCQRHEHVWPEP